MSTSLLHAVVRLLDEAEVDQASVRVTIDDDPLRVIITAPHAAAQAPANRCDAKHTGDFPGGGVAPWSCWDGHLDGANISLHGEGAPAVRA